MPGPMDDLSRHVSAMRDFVSEIREVAEGLGTPAPSPRTPRSTASQQSGPDAEDIRRVNAALIIAFANGMRWSLTVPGQHTPAPPGRQHSARRWHTARAPRSSTLTNDDLLGYLAAMGKDFAADSRTMHNRVKIDLLNEFENYPRLVGPTQVKQFAAAVILETIIKRIKLDLRDVRIKANSAAWTERKARSGWSTRVGEQGGGLVSAIEATGRVEFE